MAVGEAARKQAQYRSLSVLSLWAIESSCLLGSHSFFPGRAKGEFFKKNHLLGPVSGQSWVPSLGHKD